jgi:IclR family transcriptional regulator, pca regulon regulatory protein
MEILETFTPESPRLTLQEVTRKIGLPQTTVHRLLYTLTYKKYIVCDAQKKYYLGPKFASLGMTVLASLELREVALPFLEDLSRESQQNTNLGILDGTEVVYIQRVEKKSLISMNLQVGSRLNCYETSMGRAILAFLDAEKLETVLKEVLRTKGLAQRIGARGEALLNILAGVRRRGYALDDEEWLQGVRAIAAPVFNMQGKVAAAVNMPVFSPAISRKKLIQDFVPILMSATEKISSSLGYRSPQTRVPLRTGLRAQGLPVTAGRSKKKI